jgi:hypothetical protein
VRRTRLRAALVGAGAPLVLLLAGCGGSSSGSATTAVSPTTAACVNAGATSKAYVVVDHGGGRSSQRCVGFDGEQITGEDLMTRSGVQFQAQTFSGIGKAVCQLDNEPAQFTECFPKDKPYWALYVSHDGGTWEQPQTGYTGVTLKNGDALGWEYESATASPPPPPPPTPKR